MKKTNETLRRNTFKTYFFRDVKLAGEYEFPYVFNQKIQNFEFDFIPFNVFMSIKNKNKYGVHFFIDDYHFERVWNCIEKYISLLRKCKVVIGPDFSIYEDMPKSLKIYNTYRNRAITSYLQSRGIKVVPVISWSSEDDFKWCFDGVEEKSVIAISTNGVLKNVKSKEIFLKGYLKMLEVLNPAKVILIGQVPIEIDSPLIINKKSFSQVLKEKRCS